MCARYTLTLDQTRLVIARLVHIFAFAPRYNIGPTQRVPVLMDTSAGVKAVEMRWGIPSAWSKTLHINAQAERIQQTEVPFSDPARTASSHAVNLNFGGRGKNLIVRALAA